MKKIKEVLMFTIIVIAVGIIMAVIIIKLEKKNMIDKEKIQNTVTVTTNVEPTEDSLRFKKEYEEINGTIREKDGMAYNTVFIDENNPIVYIGIEKLVEILENQDKTIIYISSPTCPYCRATVNTMLNAAKKLGISEIYYYDISANESGKANYTELLEKIIEKKIADKTNDGSISWTLPQLLNVKNSNIIASTRGIDYEFERGQTKYSELTEKQKNHMYEHYFDTLSK